MTPECACLKCKFFAGESVSCFYCQHPMQIEELPEDDTWVLLEPPHEIEPEHCSKMAHFCCLPAENRKRFVEWWEAN